MAEFYIEREKNASGTHAIHFSTCDELPAMGELLYLGSIASYESAEKQGYGYYNEVSACPKCAAKYSQAS